MRKYVLGFLCMVLAVCAVFPAVLSALSLPSEAVDTHMYHHVVAHDYESGNNLEDVDDDYYTYDNSYFNKNSYDDLDYDLAQLAFALAFAGLGSSEEQKDARGNPILTSQQTENVKEILCAIGCEPTSYSDGFTVPEADSIGSFIASKDIPLDGKDYTAVFVVIRGGNYQNEWAGDFHVGLSGEHHGFAIAANKVYARLTTYIANRFAGQQKNLKILICGYSRGGAVTNLLAKRLDENVYDGSIYKHNGKMKNPDGSQVVDTDRLITDPGTSLQTRVSDIPNTVTIKLENIYAYGFEVPMGAVNDVTTKYQGHTLTDNIYSIVNGADFVPMVAPAAYGFQRYGRTYFLPNDQTTASEKNAAINKFNSYFNEAKYKIEDNQSAALENLFATLTAIFPTRNSYVNRLQGLIMELWESAYSNGTTLTLSINKGDFSEHEIQWDTSINLKLNLLYVATADFLAETTDFFRIRLLRMVAMLNEPERIHSISISTPNHLLTLKKDEASTLASGVLQSSYILLGKDRVVQFLSELINDLMYSQCPIGLISSLFDDFCSYLDDVVTPLVQGHYPELCCAWMSASKTTLTEMSASDLENDNQYTISLKAGTGGKVIGSGKEYAGKPKLIEAVPNAGYAFDGWYSSDGKKALNLPNPYSYYVDSDLSVMAKFVKTSDTTNAYLEGCTALPAAGRITISVNNGELWSLPTIDTSKGSELLWGSSVMTKGIVLTYTAVYKNHAGNYWFLTEYNGKIGFIYSEDVTPKDSSTNIKSDFIDGKYPASIIDNSYTFFPGGTVKTNIGNIDYAGVFVKDKSTGKYVGQWKVAVHGDPFCTEYSFEKQFCAIDDVANGIKSLPIGNYTLQYVVRITTTTVSKGVNYAFVTSSKNVNCGSRDFIVSENVTPSTTGSVKLGSKTVSSDKVVVRATGTVSGGVANDVERIGIRIYDASGNLLKRFKMQPTYYSDARTTRNMVFTIGKGLEVDLPLKQNKTYTYEIYMTVKGFEFKSVGTFRTTSAPVTPSVDPDDPDVSGGGANSQYTVFSQKDPRWGGLKYGQTDAASTIAEAGCCPLSIVNGVYYLTGIFIEPTAVCDFAVASGCRGDSGGTSQALYKLFFNQYGEDYGVKLDKQMSFAESSWDEITEALNDGKIVFVKNSHHYMVLVDYNAENDLFLMLDSSGWNTRNTKDTGYAWLSRNQLRGKNGWCDGHGVVGFACWIVSSTDESISQFNGSQNTDKEGYYYLSADSLTVYKNPSTDSAVVTTLTRGSIVHVTSTGESGENELWYKIENGYVRPTITNGESDLVAIEGGYVFEKKDISTLNSSYESSDYVYSSVYAVGARSLNQTTSFGCVIYTLENGEYAEAARAVDNRVCSGIMYYNVSLSPLASNTKFYTAAGERFAFAPGQTYYYRMYVNYTRNGETESAYSYNFENGSPYNSFTVAQAPSISATYSQLRTENVTALTADVHYYCKISDGIKNNVVSRIGVLLYDDEGTLIGEAFTDAAPVLSGKNDFFYDTYTLEGLAPDTEYLAQIYSVLSGVTILSDYIPFRTAVPSDLDLFLSTAEDAAGFYYVCADDAVMYSQPNSAGTPATLSLNGVSMSTIPATFIVYADKIGTNTNGETYFHLVKRDIGFYCDQIGDVFVESGKLSPLVAGTYRVVPFSSSSYRLILWENEDLTGNNGSLYRGDEFTFTGEIKGDLGTAEYNGKTGWIKIGYSTFVSPAEVVISYDANGGDEAPENQNVDYWTTAQLSELTPKRDGYDFVGWAESDDAESADYSAGGAFFADRSVTLYAVWRIHEHSFGQWTHLSDATCVDPGVETRLCLLCGAAECQNDEEPLGHTYEDETIEPTCAFSGFVKHTCTRCGEITADSFTEKTPHSFGAWTVAVQPTLNEDGERTHTCLVCGEEERLVIEKLIESADFNDDGNMTISDVTALLDYLAYDVGYDIRYDLSFDGGVTISDVTLLLDYLSTTN